MSSDSYEAEGKERLCVLPIYCRPMLTDSAGCRTRRLLLILKCRLGFIYGLGMYVVAREFGMFPGWHYIGLYCCIIILSEFLVCVYVCLFGIYNGVSFIFYYYHHFFVSLLLFKFYCIRAIKILFVCNSFVVVFLWIPGRSSFLFYGFSLAFIYPPMIIFF